MMARSTIVAWVQSAVDSNTASVRLRHVLSAVLIVGLMAANAQAAVVNINANQSVSAINASMADGDTWTIGSGGTVNVTITVDVDSGTYVESLSGDRVEQTEDGLTVELPPLGASVWLKAGS